MTFKQKICSYYDKDIVTFGDLLDTIIKYSCWSILYIIIITIPAFVFIKGLFIILNYGIFPPQNTFINMETGKYMSMIGYAMVLAVVGTSIIEATIIAGTWVQKIPVIICKKSKEYDISEEATL